MKYSMKVFYINSKLLAYQEPFSNYFRVFFSIRQQRVFLNGQKSNLAPILTGDPQGSVLISLLFFTFINDLPAKLELLVDDASLFSTIYDPLRLKSY